MTARPKPSRGETCTAARHGDHVAYDWWGCRCPQAREAHRLYRKRSRENRQPAALVAATGTARRLQALVAAGYSWRLLGEHLKVHARTVRDWAVDPDGQVRRSTAERVTAVFSELADKPGQSRYALTVARRYGWLPPLAWDDIDDPDSQPSLGGVGADIVDEIAVERALSGDHVDLTDAELVLVLQAGVARGEPLSHLAERLGINCWGARKMLGGELPPRREKRARVEAEILRSRANDYAIAANLGVNRSTVSRARARLIASGALGAA